MDCRLCVFMRHMRPIAYAISATRYWFIYLFIFIYIHLYDKILFNLFILFYIVNIHYLFINTWRKCGFPILFLVDQMRDKNKPSDVPESCAVVTRALCVGVWFWFVVAPFKHNFLAVCIAMGFVWWRFHVKMVLKMLMLMAAAADSVDFDMRQLMKMVIVSMRRSMCYYC